MGDRKRINVVTAGPQSVPRAPGGLPLVGDAWSMWKDPLGFLKSLRPAGELVRVDLGTFPIYVATTPETTHQVLVTQGRHFEKGRMFDRVRSFLGDGLGTATNEVHHKHRKIVQPMFHRARIAGYGQIMSDLAQALSASWKAGETISVEQEMSEFAIGTLAATMFANSSEIDRPTMEVIRQDVPVILKNIFIRAITPKFLDLLPVGPNRQFDAASRRLSKVIDEMIVQAHRGGTSDQPDLLSLLLDARYADGSKLSDSQVRDELVTILFAGTETVATTLSWVFYEIGRNPEVEKRMLEEIDAVVGDREASIDDVPRLEYTRRVMDETIRLHSAPMLMRRAVAPVEIGQYSFEAGTEFALSLYALHQHPDLYPDPQRFDPDRWLEGKSRELSREAFIPFGGGNRKCIGDAFAWTEITIALATILSRWRLRPVPNHTTRELLAAMPLPGNLPMIVTSRAA